MAEDNDGPKFEYRIGWNASSNASFRGVSDWEEWGGFEETIEEVRDELHEGRDVSQGLQEALEYSGFEWWVDVRAASDDTKENPDG